MRKNTHEILIGLSREEYDDLVKCLHVLEIKLDDNILTKIQRAGWVEESILLQKQTKEYKQKVRYLLELIEKGDVDEEEE